MPANGTTPRRSSNISIRNRLNSEVTPLQDAILKRNVSMIRSVLKTKNGKKDINTFFHPYKNMGALPMETPLLYVIGDTSEMKKWKHDDRLEALDILMKHGADPNKRYICKKYHPENPYVYDTPVSRAIRLRDYKALKVLLKRGMGRKKARLSDPQSPDGDTYLHQVVNDRKSTTDNDHRRQLLVEILTKYGAPPDKENARGNPPHIDALSRWDHAVARKLIECGAKLKPKALYKAPGSNLNEPVADIVYFAMICLSHNNLFTSDTLCDYQYIWNEYFKRGGSPNVYVDGEDTLLSAMVRLHIRDHGLKKKLLRFFISKGASVKKPNKDTDGTRPVDVLLRMKNNGFIPNANQNYINDMVKILGGIEHKKNVTLLGNMNMTDPISLNTVRLNNAYILKPDIVNTTIQTKNGRKTTRTVRQVYEKSSLNSLIRSGRTLQSPVTRRPFTPLDIIKLTDVVPENRIKNFKKNSKNS